MTRIYFAMATIAAAGCAPPVLPSPPPAPPPPVVVTAAPAAPAAQPLPAERNPAKLRLGHYSTPDGLTGLVLDRAASPPRARLDGKTDVIELAVRRVDEDEAYLVSADEVLLIHIGDWGGLQLVPEKGSPIVLVRDGAGEALAAPALRAPDNSAATAKATKACGTPVRFDIATPLKPSSERGAAHLLVRATTAIMNVCRDDAGRAAVKQKIHVVRIGAGSATKLSLDGGTLVVEGELESESLGPFRQEIQSFVEKKL